MVYAIRTRDDFITVTLSGSCGEGTEHRRTIREIVQVLRDTILACGATRVELDCRDLQYTGGDSISWIWVAVHKDGLECTVRAKGETKALLSELMEIGLRVPITE